MTAASKSVYYFGFYLLLTGITLTVAPNVMLSLLGIAETTEVWIHVLGAVVFNIGLLYVYMAPANHSLFLMLTVYARVLIMVWFTLFYFLGWGPPQIILFGVIDLLGAVWTYSALRKGN